MALLTVFIEPMRCCEPGPLIGPRKGAGDDVHSGRLLTDLRSYEAPVIQEVHA